MTLTAIKYIKALESLNMPVDVVEEARSLYESEEQLKLVLENPVVNKEQKYAVIDRIFPEKIRNLLKSLCKNSDMEFFDEIAGGYKAYYNSLHKTLNATLTYVNPPADSQLEDIKKFLCKTYQAENVDLTMEQDPALIGGFILTAEGEEYDWSLRGRIEGLRSKLTGGETNGSY